MIAKPELIKKVKDYFDLNIYETKVWLALLTRGISSAGEIAEVSGVPRSRTYDVLESLEKRGFAIEKLGKPVKYLAVKPSVVIEKLKNNTMKYAEEKVEVLSKLKDTKEYEELQTLHTTGIEPMKNHELSSSIKGRSNLYSQLRDTMESADTSVYLATSAYELMSKQKMFSEVFAKLKKRNVDIKIIVSDDESEVKKLVKKFNVPIKSKHINSRFLMADRKELIFTLKPTNVHEDYDYAFWINSEYFTNSLAYMFELAWNSN
ncbi:Putative HTH-type transcriptional regulator TrmBL2 [uncultured archaeon]|nr:Putative HTH-type transcriptional regulator TrmBL2 [uncultured archaeon]